MCFDTKREPDGRVSIKPNGTVWLMRSDAELGELVSGLTSAAATQERSRLAVELNSADRDLPGEEPEGAGGPDELLTVYLLAPLAERLLGMIFDGIVRWLRGRRNPRADHTIVRILGPDGEVLREVVVERRTIRPLDRASD